MTSYLFDKLPGLLDFTVRQAARDWSKMLWTCFVYDMRQGDEVVTNSRMRGLW